MNMEKKKKELMMKKLYNNSDYLVHKPRLAAYFARQPQKSTMALIANYAADTGCPLLVLIDFAEEILGTNETIAAARDRLYSFYK